MTAHARDDIQAGSPLTERLGEIDWTNVGVGLDAHGFAVLPHLLELRACDAISALYDSDGFFRSRVVMTRHHFGSGEYKYFGYPLPDIIADLRARLYPHLAIIANRWSTALGMDHSYPADLKSYLERCHRAGQTRPTPLPLKYGTGDYNCLHQDLYGEHVFPLQVAFLLSRPGEDFAGGEFALTEQRPRMQSRIEVVPLQQGDGVCFPVRHRPVVGGRGAYRVVMRHGVSRVHSGLRFTLGIIFHDAT